MAWNTNFIQGLKRIVPGDQGGESNYQYAYTPGEAVGVTVAQVNPGTHIFAAVLPGTVEEFGTGLGRIFTGTVGETNKTTGRQNPTWEEAWRPIPQGVGEAVGNAAGFLGQTAGQFGAGVGRGLFSGLGSTGTLIVVAAVLFAAAVVLKPTAS